MNVKIDHAPKGDRLLVRFSHNELDTYKARAIPDRTWNKTLQAWTCRPTLKNIQYLHDAWSRAIWSEAAQKRANEIYNLAEQREAVLKARKDGAVDTAVLEGVPFQKPPMAHQKTALVLGRNQRSFAYFMDQGTGKTKTLIDDACHNWRENRIDAVLLFTLNSVKTNWVIFDSMKDHPEDKDALEDHMPPDVPYIKGLWVSQATGRVKQEWERFTRKVHEESSDRQNMVWLVANIESLRVDRAFDYFEQFIMNFDSRVMIVIDESTLIGTPGSKQTKAALKLRKRCAMARILSGTPVLKSPMKAYTQMGFLDENILGHSSYYSFRNRYAVMGGYQGRQILNYVHLDELQERMQSASYRVLKSECLELPPQIFQKRRVEMLPAQLKAYREMQEEFITENEEAGIVEASIVLTQMLRLQQITGGYLPRIDDVSGKTTGIVPLVRPDTNPKYVEALRILEECGDQRAIIWCRFTHEIDDLHELLVASSISAEKFYGAMSDEEKLSVRKRFARDNSLRVIVGNPMAGGLGIDEFKHASVVIYLSNTFDTEKRKQSEDRTHRIGSQMHKQITYYDIVVPNTVDMKILAVMRGDAKVSARVMADQWQEWI